MSQRVLVTGASGLLGASICPALLSAGFEVTGTWQNNNPVLLHPKFSYQRLDLSRPEELAALEHYDAIVHSAARIPGDGRNDVDCATANRALDDALIVHLRNSGFGGRLVFISSAYIACPELLSASRYLQEKEISESQFAAAFPDTCSLRITSPYGPVLRHRNVLSIFLNAVLHGDDITLYGSGNRSQDFVHAVDVAAAVAAALRFSGKLPPVMNVASGKAVSMLELAALVIGLVPQCRSRVVFSGRPDPQENFRAAFSIEQTASVLAWQPRIELKEGLQTWLEAQS